MANSRTNSLHQKLPVELRRQVEEDLIEQPPGRETYDKVYEHYQLDVHGVSLKALQRYGGYLRALKRNEFIRDIGDDLLNDVDLSPKIEGLIRSRLYEQLVAGDVEINDLRFASMAEKNLRQSRIMSEMWAAKQRELKAGVEQLATKDGSHQVDAAKVADLIDKVMRGEQIG